MIIDTHAHLWLKQDTTVDGSTIRALAGNASRSTFFGQEVQMLPPFMIDGRNTAEVFLSNLDYAQVSAAVIVQEVIDGNQDTYLADVQAKYPERFLCARLYFPLVSEKEGKSFSNLDILDSFSKGEKEGESSKGGGKGGFRLFAFPAHRYHGDLNTPALMADFKAMEASGLYLDICLDDNERQIAQFDEVLQECPDLKVAIGHFGMATTKNWSKQILLARHKNVMVESGGITWLYNSEFYPYPSAIKAIKEAADMVGMDKLMWGSDYPRTITAITYKMSYDFVLKSRELSDNEKNLFLGENATRFYKFQNLEVPKHIKNMSE